MNGVTFGNLAQRKRQLVRDELAEAALKLLAFRGFEETTIDEITAAAGVSRRTFFRYYKSKEDVIIEFLGHVGEEMQAALAARPASETPTQALRQTLTVFTDACVAYPEKSVRLTRLILTTPSLTARYLERQLEWKNKLAAQLQKRLGGKNNLRPVVLIGMAFAALDAALDTWSASDGKQDLAELLDEAFAIAFSAD
ncbi:TetR family transcriptional regulator [Catelliglobosispora koreensis]|uniref:TetR family transcriptional regulator n=1 Tax=Catelliglobosispora koreensis TaxID=129052 RepID=UPI0012F859D5